jgi:hypothetical protein
MLLSIRLKRPVAFQVRCSLVKRSLLGRLYLLVLQSCDARLLFFVACDETQISLYRISLGHRKTPSAIRGTVFSGIRIDRKSRIESVPVSEMRSIVHPLQIIHPASQVLFEGLIYLCLEIFILLPRQTLLPLAHPFHVLPRSRSLEAAKLNEVGEVPVSSRPLIAQSTKCGETGLVFISSS